MGCGKSSVGRELSRLLCCLFMDLDDVIAESEGRTIPEIFATDGEAAFRQMELEALQTLVGGGWSKTESLPRLRRGPLPFTRPRAATVFDSPSTDQDSNIALVLALAQSCSNTSLSAPATGVLALGGGTVMTPECANIVKEHTICIYLRASVDTLLEHLSEEADNRPMLDSSNKSDDKQVALRNRITELMSLRSDIYEKTAHIIIDTDGKSIVSISQEVISTIVARRQT